MTYIDADHYGARIEARVTGKLRDSEIGQVIETDDRFLLPLAIFDEADLVDPPHTDPEFVPGMVVRSADDPSRMARWHFFPYVDEAHPWLTSDGFRLRREELPDRLAVAYDHRQDTP